MTLIRKPSEIAIKQTLSALVYGQPGIGKTTLGCSAPNAVLFDYDGGVQRINGAHQVPTVQITGWEETADALKEIEDTMPECRTIVIDTVGKMLDYMSASIIRNDPKMAQRDGSLSLKGYGVRKNMFVNFLRQVSLMGRNVIFIAHEKEERRGDETVKRPEVGGSSANDLVKELDLVGYMQAIGKERTITFDPNESYYAKNTCNLPPLIKIPVVVDEKGNATGENKFFASVIEAYKRAQERNKEATSEYEDLMEFIRGEIAEADTVDGINALVEKLPTLQHVFNSKLLATAGSHESARRAVNLNITCNRQRNHSGSITDFHIFG